MTLVKDPTTEQFERLISEHKNKMFRHAKKLAGNHEDATDLMQETCIRIYRNMDSLTTEKTFYSWSLRIMTRIFLDKKRHDARRIRYDSMDAASENLGVEFEVGDEKVNLERDLLRQERNAEIRAAVDELPEHYSYVVKLHHLEGMSFPEIAERCGIEVGTARSRTFRGRAILRKTLCFT